MELKEPMVRAAVSAGFKSTDVGVIPQDWLVIKLSDCISVYRGGSPRPIENFITYDLKGVNWIKIGDAERNGKYIRLASEKITPAGVKFSREVRAGDFLLSNSMSFGRPYILAVDGCVHDGWLVLQNYQAKFDKDFLYYTLSDRYLLDQYRAKAAGSGVLNLNKQLVGTVHLRVPPLPEQRAIATALSNVDGLIAGLESLLAKKRALKQGAMQQLLTGQKRLQGFTGDWQVTSIESIVQRVTGFWGASNQTKETPRNANIIRAGDITPDGRLVATAPRYLSDAEYDRSSCVKGDVIITVSGNGLGKVWLCDGRPDVCASNFVRILKPRLVLVGAFLYYKLGTSNAQKLMVEYTATSAYPNLRPSFFSVHWLKLPPIEEQIAIATVLSDMDAELTALEAKLDKTRLLKQGMMQELLTGRVRLV